MRKLLLATAALGAMCAPALADSLIVSAFVDGSLVSTQTSADGNLNIGSQSFGPDFNLNSLSINSETFLAAPDLLSTNTLDVNQNVSGNHTLVINVRALGLTGPNALTNLLSSFSVSGMTGGWTAEEKTFIGGIAGTPLADTGVFSQTADSAFSTNPAFLSNPFEADVQYTINATGIGRFNGGIDISAVPGPTLGAGLPGLLGGLGLLGFIGTRRQKTI